MQVWTNVHWPAMRPRINPPIDRYLLPAGSPVLIARTSPESQWHNYITTRDIWRHDSHPNPHVQTPVSIKEGNWQLKVDPSLLITYDYAIIHAIQFKTTYKVVTIWPDEYGLTQQFKAVDSNKTLLDVVAGDAIYDSRQQLTVDAIRVYRSSPTINDKLGISVASGMAWLDEINASHSLPSIAEINSKK